MELYLDDIKNFLGGTFHQDIDSVEQALQEFINESSSKVLSHVVSELDFFLTDTQSDEQKSEFIKYYVDGYNFEDLSPLEWLRFLLDTLKKALCEREKHLPVFAAQHAPFIAFLRHYFGDTTASLEIQAACLLETESKDYIREESYPFFVSLECIGLKEDVLNRFTGITFERTGGWPLHWLKKNLGLSNCPVE